jgi:hypothetical protein
LQGILREPVAINPLDPRDIPDGFGWKAPPYEYEFVKAPMDILAGHCRWRQMVEANASPWQLAAAWSYDEAAWIERRKPFLLY